MPASENKPSSNASQSALKRSLPLLGAVVIALALVGFLLGIIEGETPTAPAAAPRAIAHWEGTDQQVAPAASYSAIHMAKFSPNSNWSGKLEQLKYQRPSRLDPVTRHPDAKLAAIHDRTVNRAFDGAPPVIPHRIEQQSSKSCLACHENGMKLGNRIASVVSHPHFTNCTQCHVESSTSGPFDQPVMTQNSFDGISRSGTGTRAIGGAPPTIPHTTWLRDNCMSCHGTIARDGLRTSHPWLTNCRQCHAVSADLNQTGQWSTPGP